MIDSAIPTPSVFLPRVAIDLGWIVAMRRPERPLNNLSQYIIPEIAIHESMTCETACPAERLRRLGLFLRANQNNTYMASQMPHFLEHEKDPGCVAPPSFVVNQLWNAPHLNAFPIKKESFARALRRKSLFDNPYVKVQEEFEGGRHHFATIFSDEARKRGLRPELSQSAINESIVMPDLIGEWCSKFDEKYSTPEWLSALNVFPDAHAVGRWWRIAIWYWLRAARGVGPKRLRNDWADSVYLFTASYCHSFWTTDRTSAEIVRLLFPSVSVRYAAPQDVRWE